MSCNLLYKQVCPTLLDIQVSLTLLDIQVCPAIFWILRFVLQSSGYTGWSNSSGYSGLSCNLLDIQVCPTLLDIQVSPTLLDIQVCPAIFWIIRFVQLFWIYRIVQLFLIFRFVLQSSGFSGWSISLKHKIRSISLTCCCRVTMEGASPTVTQRMSGPCPRLSSPSPVKPGPPHHTNNSRLVHSFLISHLNNKFRG